MAARGKFRVTKVVEFAAAHRLYREEYTDARNAELFGPCANPYGHGHNYVLECTFEGERHPESEMVVHFAALKRMLNELVVAPLDHRHMNHDVEFLKGVLPTSENLVALLWDRIQAGIKDPSYRLARLRLSSSPRNWVEYEGAK